MRSHVLGLAAGLFVFAGCGSSTSVYGGAGGGGGGGSSTSCTSTSTKVCMIGLTFSPASLTIAAGGTVTWQNGSSATHTVTSSSLSTATFNSGNPPAGVAPAGTFSHTFPTAGTYHYYCQYHGADGNPPTGMAGTIIVQ